MIASYNIYFSSFPLFNSSILPLLKYTPFYCYYFIYPVLFFPFIIISIPFPHLLLCYHPLSWCRYHRTLCLGASTNTNCCYHLMTAFACYSVFFARFNGGISWPEFGVTTSLTLSIFFSRVWIRCKFYVSCVLWLQLGVMWCEPIWRCSDVFDDVLVLVLEGRRKSSSRIYDGTRWIIISWLGCTSSTARVDTAVD